MKSFFFVLCLLSIKPLCALEPVLDFPTAAQRILEHASALKMADAEVGIKESEAWQAALLPNPAVSLQYDSFGGNHSYRGWGEVDLSVSVSQLVLMGGKRSAAMTTADYRTRVAAWDGQILRQDLLLELTQAFIDAALAQDKVKIVEQQSKMAQNNLESVKAKREKNKASVLELKKAEIALHANDIALIKARGALLTAKRKLAGLWGDGECDFSAINFDLTDIQTPQPLESLESRLQQCPELLKAQTERWAAYSATRLEKSRSVPDLDVGVSFSICHHWDDYSFSIAVGLPLPLFDYNQANISRAEWEEWQVIYGMQNIQTTLSQKLAEAYHKWQQSFEEAKTLQELSSAAAREALAAIEQDFHDGKAEQDDYVDAQKLTLDVQSDFLDAAAEYFRAKAEVLRIATAL